MRFEIAFKDILIYPLFFLIKTYKIVSFIYIYVTIIPILYNYFYNL